MTRIVPIPIADNKLVSEDVRILLSDDDCLGLKLHELALNKLQIQGVDVHEDLVDLHLVLEEEQDVLQGSLESIVVENVGVVV